MEQRQSSIEAMPNLPPSPSEVLTTPETQQVPSPETLIDNRNEITERQLGHFVESAHQPQAQIPTLPAPIDDTGVASSAQLADDTGMPVVAADEDLIEKEWVAKAKEVITATKDDPYRREQEVKKLQLEYVRKRYGREIGNDND